MTSSVRELHSPATQLRSIAILDARNRYRTDPDDPAIRKEIDWVVESILAETFPMR